MDLEKEGYKLIVEDSDMEVRLDPREIQGYILFFKKDNKKNILFPRGTLEDLARTDRDMGKEMIKNLIPYAYKNGGLFRGTNLNYDSIIAIATKAFLKEQEDYEIYKIQQGE